MLCLGGEGEVVREPDETRQIVHKTIHRQCRASLNQPVGIIGNLTPRAAVLTPEGKRKVATWLKFLERSARHGRDPDDPVVSYDYAWMWRELKIENLRE